MLRLAAGGALSLCALLGGAGSAQAAAVSMAGALRANVVDLSDGGITLIGQVDRNSGTDSAVQIDVRQTASGGYRGVATAYEERGSVTGPVELSASLSSTGLLTDGKMTARRGTGRLARPDGTLRIAASTDLDTGLTAGTVAGRIVFRRVPSSPLPPPAVHRYAARLLGIGVGVQQGIETIVAQVRGMTSTRGLMILKNREVPGTAPAHWTYFDAAGTFSGTTPLRRTPDPDGDIALRPGLSRILAGTGRYRRARGVRAMPGQPGRRDRVSTFFRFGLNGLLSY